MSNWKKIYQHLMLTTYQNKEGTTEIGIQKIYIGTKKSDYVWRVTKSIPHRMTKLIVLGDFSTKKEGLLIAYEYMKINRD